MSHFSEISWKSRYFVLEIESQFHCGKATPVNITDMKGVVKIDTCLGTYRVILISVGWTAKVQFGTKNTKIQTEFKSTSVINDVIKAGPGVIRNKRD